VFKKLRFQVVEGVEQGAPALKVLEYLALQKQIPGVDLIGHLEAERELRFMKPDVGKIRSEGKYVGVGLLVGKMQPERIINRRRKCPGSAERHPRNPDSVGDVKTPTEENIGDDARRASARFIGEASQQLLKGVLKHLASTYEGEKETVGKRISVLHIRRQAFDALWKL
jgi:hypothetical protein